MAAKQFAWIHCLTIRSSTAGAAAAFCIGRAQCAPFASDPEFVAELAELRALAGDLDVMGAEAGEAIAAALGAEPGPDPPLQLTAVELVEPLPGGLVSGAGFLEQLGGLLRSAAVPRSRIQRVPSFEHPSQSA